jgi:PEP-CTERM/exosortase A-associated glycosyltransferase
MKILHILDHSLPLHSGYTFRSQNIFKAQQKMGFNPIILTSPKHEESYKKRCPEIERINHLTYYRSGNVESTSIPVMYELKLMHKLYKKMLHVIDIEKPDIIHAHSPILNGFPAIRAGRKKSLTVVYEIRAFWEDAAVDHGTYAERSWKYNLTKFLETQVCKKVDHICILCNGLKNDLIKRGISSSKITPVFNGVNTEELRVVEPDREFQKAWNLDGKTVIGFVGSFYRYEGLDLLIRAFAKLFDTDKNLRLLLVGGGEMKQELIELSERLGVRDQVIMPGRIPHERIAGVYSMIDILAYPRYSMRLTELVTPLKPLEAMAMGKAFVASDVGGHKELILDGKTGLLFQAGDVESLTNALLKFITDSEFKEKAQQNAAKWVNENHKWEQTTSVYKKIYETII